VRHAIIVTGRVVARNPDLGIIDDSTGARAEDSHEDEEYERGGETEAVLH
jgi:hypothetical protein